MVKGRVLWEDWPIIVSLVPTLPPERSQLDVLTVDSSLNGDHFPPICLPRFSRHVQLLTSSEPMSFEKSLSNYEPVPQEGSNGLSLSSNANIISLRSNTHQALWHVDV